MIRLDESVDQWGMPLTSEPEQPLEESSDERHSITSLYHGTWDKSLSTLEPRPLAGIDTFGTWLADMDSASNYGPVLYKVKGPEQSVNLASYFSTDEMLAEHGLEKLDAASLKTIKRKLQKSGFDGVEFRSLDGTDGVFVCLWHDYPIELEKVKEQPLEESIESPIKKQIIDAAQDAVRMAAPAYFSGSFDQDEIDHAQQRFVFSVPAEDASEEEVEEFYDSGLGQIEMQLWDDTVEREKAAIKKELEVALDQETEKRINLLQAAEQQFLEIFPDGYTNLRAGGGVSHYFITRVGDEEIKFRVSNHEPAYHHTYDFRYDDGDLESLAAAIEEMLKVAQTYKWSLSESLEESVGGLYHLSPNKFSEFKQAPSRGKFGVDLGFHFGTEEQALKRLDQLQQSGRVKPGSPVYLYRVTLNVSNPIHIEENRLGANTASDLIQAIMKMAEQGKVSGVTDEMLDGWYDDQLMLGDENLSDISMESPEKQIDLFRGFLAEIGHDSVTYENAFEGPGLSYIVFDPAQIEIQEVEELGVGGVAEEVDRWGIPLNEMKLKPIQWVMPTEAQIQDEFHEGEIYNLLIGAGYPSKEEEAEALDFFKSNLERAEIDPKDLDASNAWRFRFKDYSSMRKTVTSYGGPKDPDSMIKKIQSGGSLPMPVVLRKADGKMLLAGGATRTAIAGLADQKIQALVFDEKKALERQIKKYKDKVQAYIERSARTPDIQQIADRVESESKKPGWELSGPWLKEIEAKFGKKAGFEAYNLGSYWGIIRRMERQIS